MNKPYIRKKHVIMEIIGYMFLLVSLILVIVLSARSNGDIPMHISMDGTIERYGDGKALIMLPMTMFIVNVSTSFIIHLISADMWNFPVKIKPGKEILVYSDAVSMMMIFQLIDAVFSLVFVFSIFITKTGGFLGMATAGLLIGITIDIVFYIVKMIRDSK